MREEESNWFVRWEEELPSPEELISPSQTLISPDLALAFDIRNPNNTHHHHPPQLPSFGGAPQSQANSAAAVAGEFGADSGELGCGSGGDETARTLKRPRLVWTPHLHKRFVDAVAHLGIKNAVPKTIMQLMSVDGLTRENVASHLQKYRLYLKRIQGLSSGGGNNGGISDSAMDRLFASQPVPAQFFHSGRSNSEHFLPFVPMAAIQQHHHQQQIAGVVAHPQYHRQIGHFGSPPNEGFSHPFLARQPLHRAHNAAAPKYVDDLETPNANGRTQVLTLFPTGEESTCLLDRDTSHGVLVGATDRLIFEPAGEDNNADFLLETSLGTYCWCIICIAYNLLAACQHLVLVS